MILLVVLGVEFFINLDFICMLGKIKYGGMVILEVLLYFSMVIVEDFFVVIVCGVFLVLDIIWGGVWLSVIFFLFILKILWGLLNKLYFVRIDDSLIKYCCIFFGFDDFVCWYFNVCGLIIFRFG